MAGSDRTPPGPGISTCAERAPPAPRLSPSRNDATLMGRQPQGTTRSEAVSGLAAWTPMRLTEPLADERRARAALAWMLDRLESLCAQDTTTGREDAGLPALLAVLHELGADVALHRVASGRSNVLATWGAPELVFSTHVDTVPPYLPPRLHVDGADVELSGRGACDAKGQIVCQLAAVRALLERGTCGPAGRGLAWLGVVGEETDSDGAKHAAATLPAFDSARALINGEPT